MRGLGAFQRAQMRETDPRIHSFFSHVRQAVDVLEQIMLKPHRMHSEASAVKEEIEKTVPATSTISAESPRMSYTIKEVRKLVGISNTAIYRAIGSHELRAVKFGHKTLILAKDLQDWLGNLKAIR